jgi:hypothetical protein
LVIFNRLVIIIALAALSPVEGCECGSLGESRVNAPPLNPALSRRLGGLLATEIRE